MKFFKTRTDSVSWFGIVDDAMIVTVTMKENVTTSHQIRSRNGICCHGVSKDTQSQKHSSSANIISSFVRSGAMMK